MRIMEEVGPTLSFAERDKAKSGQTTFRRSDKPDRSGCAGCSAFPRYRKPLRLSFVPTLARKPFNPQPLW